MKILSRALLASGSLLLLAGIGFADTLELKDGRVLQGKYLGGTQAVLRFQVNGDVQTFPTNDIVALTFTRNSGSTPAPAAAPPPQEEPAPAQPPSQAALPPATANSYAGGDLSVPAGQSILVRMIDGVDSSKNHVGDLFHASLETDVLEPLSKAGEVMAYPHYDFWHCMDTVRDAKYLRELWDTGKAPWVSSS